MSGKNRRMRLAIALGFLGTLVLMASFWWNNQGMQNEVQRLAYFQAKAAISLPLSSLQATMEQRWLTMLLTHLGLWIAGIGCLFLGTRYADRATGNREKTTLELEESLAVMDSLIDALPVGVVLVGRDKVVRRINQTALGILNKTEDEVVGSICHQNICPAQLDNCPILDLNKRVDNSEKVVLGSEGKTIPVIKSVLPFVYQGEEVLLEAFVDISERQESIARLQKGMEELQQFNRLAVDRELRMVELKTEVNSLLLSQGKDRRYQMAGIGDSEVES